MKYQRDYSRQFPKVKDLASRQRKAIKILQVLKEFWGRERLTGLLCLDMGCSVGVVSDVLARDGAQVIGLDIDEDALTQRASPRELAFGFVVGDVDAAPFPDGSFDIIVCAQVYEHAPDLSLLVEEIARLLKTGGVCFFSGPNRWAIMEEHYAISFLSWLPRRWADWIVRRSGRGTEYYEQPRSAQELRRALQRFTIRDLLPDLLAHSERYAMEHEVGNLKYLAPWVPRRGWSCLGVIVPNFNWLMIKAEA